MLVRSCKIITFTTQWLFWNAEQCFHPLWLYAGTKRSGAESRYILYLPIRRKNPQSEMSKILSTILLFKPSHSSYKIRVSMLPLKPLGYREMVYWLWSLQSNTQVIYCQGSVLQMATASFNNILFKHIKHIYIYFCCMYMDIDLVHGAHELDEFVRQWNSHYIRRSHADCFPRIPDDLYDMPENYSNDTCMYIWLLHVSV